MERLRLHDRELRLLLAKNPAGLDVVLRTADELGHARNYLIAINDLVADGRDVSWLWDVDFERLARSPWRPHVVASGRRAHDLALRLKYAGLPAEQVTVEPDPAAALRLVTDRAEPGEEVMVVPTYTAMLALRAVAQRAGAVGAFWEEQA
jgi:UDP-N-acetylmuramyl tripeptide synthase